MPRCFSQFIIPVVFFICFIGCSPLPKGGDLFSLSLPTAGGDTFSFSETKNNRASVFIFLSPDCPLSQKYSLSIKNAVEEYSNKRISFYLVFPGTLYTLEEIKNFLAEYDLDIPAITDNDKYLTNALGASVTPEACMIDSAGKALYKGAIDNWFEDAGKKREVITEHYLKEAIEAYLLQQPIKISQTKAVGCIIE